MRKRYRILLLAAVVAALVVPVGFALSLESPAHVPQTSIVATTTASRLTPIVASDRDASGDLVQGAARLLVVGTTLLALAAFVRRVG